MAEPTDTDALRACSGFIPSAAGSDLLLRAADELDRRREQEQRLRALCDQWQRVADRTTLPEFRDVLTPVVADLTHLLDDTTPTDQETTASPDSWEWLGFDR